VAPLPTWVQQAVQTQLSGRLLAAARSSEPGAVQRLTLHLHPADLGSVQVVATLDDGTVSLQLAAGNPTTREALRASLSTLRSDLAAAGLDGARLDVSDQPPSSHHGPTHQPGTGGDGSRHHLGSGADHALTTGTGSGDPRHDARATGTRPRPGSRPNQGVDLHL
jgi:flagellar hook-length control protein FliK